MQNRVWLLIGIGIVVLLIAPPAVLLMMQWDRIDERLEMDRQALSAPPLLVAIEGVDALLGDERALGQIQPFEGLSTPVKEVTVSPDGRLALCGGTDMAVYLVDVPEQKVRSVLHRGIDADSLCFSPDSKRAFVTAWNNAYLFDVWSVPSLSFSMHSDFGQMTCSAYAPNGQTALTGGMIDRTVRVWNLKIGQELGRLFGQSARVCGLAYSTDGQQILSVAEDGVLIRWDVYVGRPQQRQVVYSGRVSSAAFSGDGRFVLVGGNDRSARLWDIRLMAEVHSFKGHRSDVQQVAFSRDGRRALTRSMNDVFLWDATSGVKLAEVHLLTLNAQAGVALHPDGRHVIVGGSEPGIVRMIAPEQRAPPATRAVE